MPYYLLNEKKVHERISQNKKIVYASKISDSHRAFYSKTFRVQYVDQEVDLEDACLFRFERNAKARSDNCYLALELLFAEYNSTDYAMRKEYPSQEDFEMVSLKWLTINKFKAGHGSGFYPSTFDDSHFCLLDVMIHFMLIDYQFRQTTLTWRPPPGSGKTQVYELTCKTFEHSLFPKNLIKATGNAYSEREVRSIADKHHLNYITRLISAYNSLGRVADGLDPSAISPLEVPKQMLREKTPPTPPSPKTQAPTTPSKENEEGARTDGAQSQAKASSGGGGGGGGDAKKRSKPLPPLKAAKKRFAFPSLSRFSKRILWDDDPKAASSKKVCADVTLMLTRDIKAIAEQNFQLWNTFIRLIPSKTSQIRKSLCKQYIELLHERVTCFVFREKFAHKDRWRCAPKDLFAQHNRQALQVRRAWGQATMAKLVLEDPDIFPNPSDHVVLFEESFEQFNPNNEYKGTMTSSISISKNHFSPSVKDRPPSSSAASKFRAETDPTSAWGRRTEAKRGGGEEEEEGERSKGPLPSRSSSNVSNSSINGGSARHHTKRNSLEDDPFLAPNTTTTTNISSSACMMMIMIYARCVLVIVVSIACCSTAKIFIIIIMMMIIVHASPINDTLLLHRVRCGVGWLAVYVQAWRIWQKKMEKMERGGQPSARRRGKRTSISSFLCMVIKEIRGTCGYLRTILH